MIRFGPFLALLVLSSAVVAGQITSGGAPLVAAIQVYSALSAATIVLPLTLAANIATTRYTVSSIFLSLTTGQGSAATCDFYLIGADLT